MRKHDRFEEGDDQDHGARRGALVERNDDMTRKLGVFMGDPTLGGEDDEPKEIRFEDYIIIDDIDSDPDSSDDDYEDEAGANIMESLTDQYF